MLKRNILEIGRRFCLPEKANPPNFRAAGSCLLSLFRRQIFIKPAHDALDQRLSHHAAQHLDKLLIQKRLIKPYNLLSSHFPGKTMAGWKVRAMATAGSANDKDAIDLIGFHMEAAFGNHARMQRRPVQASCNADIA